MSHISNVANKILNDADIEKENIINEAKEKADILINEAKKAKNDSIKETKKIAITRKKDVYETELLKVYSEMNQNILEYKIDIIDSIIEKASGKLLKPETVKYKSFIEKMFKISEIKKGEVLVGKKDKNIKAKDIVSIAKKLKIAIKESKEKPDFEFGVKIICGKASYNLSPYDYFTSSLDEFRIELASILFPKEE